MDCETTPATAFAHSLTGLGINLLVRDHGREAAFLRDVFGMQVFRQSADFAILLYHGQPLQLHSDAAYAGNPLPSMLPDSGPRGGGIELRLFETDPDMACAKAEAAGGHILAAPADKTGHGLREAIIMSPHGYAWLPGRRL